MYGSTPYGREEGRAHVPYGMACGAYPKHGHARGIAALQASYNHNSTSTASALSSQRRIIKWLLGVDVGVLNAIGATMAVLGSGCTP